MTRGGDWVEDLLVVELICSQGFNGKKLSQYLLVIHMPVLLFLRVRSGNYIVGEKNDKGQLGVTAMGYRNIASRVSFNCECPFWKTIKNVYAGSDLRVVVNLLALLLGVIIPNGQMGN